MEVYYNNKLLKNNEFLKVSQTQVEPEIKLDKDIKEIYTLIMHDPNAVGGNKIHWARVNITKGNINSGIDIIPYKGPAPPPNTGIHNYKFELYKQNGMNENYRPITERKFPVMKHFLEILNVGEKVDKIKFRINTINLKKTIRKRNKKSNKTRRY